MVHWHNLEQKNLEFFVVLHFLHIKKDHINESLSTKSCSKKRDFNEVWNSGNSPKHNLHHDAEEIHPNGMKKIKA